VTVGRIIIILQISSALQAHLTGWFFNLTSMYGRAAVAFNLPSDVENLVVSGTVSLQ
jgi:hypothetical protein